MEEIRGWRDDEWGRCQCQEMWEAVRERLVGSDRGGLNVGTWRVPNFRIRSSDKVGQDGIYPNISDKRAKKFQS